MTLERVEWPACGEKTPAPAEWRSGADEIAIDPDYDGCTLRVALADAPLKRKELVTGDYTLPAPRPGATVALRVTDIWGREALATAAL